VVIRASCDLWGKGLYFAQSGSLAQRSNIVHALLAANARGVIFLQTTFR